MSHNRVSHACRNCAKARVKCEETKPCSRCQDRNLVCQSSTSSAASLSSLSIHSPTVSLQSPLGQTPYATAPVRSEYLYQPPSQPHPTQQAIQYQTPMLVSSVYHLPNENEGGPSDSVQTTRISTASFPINYGVAIGDLTSNQSQLSCLLSPTTIFPLDPLEHTVVSRASGEDLSIMDYYAHQVPTNPAVDQRLTVITTDISGYATESADHLSTSCTASAVNYQSDGLTTDYGQLGWQHADVAHNSISGVSSLGDLGNRNVLGESKAWALDEDYGMH